ncbi:MAG: tRNA uridine(34) 5-carboxymethylaminomethyl modification radical SAM/GNAT enzyme Elp3 [Methanomicrobiales archaeon]|nr:tRNA uridine(34) 5-carboxymethylaminomethyl modification radical SAM/GNAT enzyme Elp3 [Methanomicrobiales archaeon]
MDESRAYREIISRIFSRESVIDLQQLKLEVCREYQIARIPKNSEIFAAAKSEERGALREILRLKPTRTLSGVAPVAVMTSPFPCPHGKCLPCPGGPDHPFHSPQSYTGEEPAALRAREHEFDPYGQVEARLTQYEALGHLVGKVELIVMGGTMTSRPFEYQEEFVTRCIQAMNEFGKDKQEIVPPFETVAEMNEAAAVRCVGITFETRPDWCRETQINRMLSLGVTKVELGVQHLDNAILSLNRRGCTVEDTIAANTLLRECGMKVGFHIMPNLPGSTADKDRRVFRELFDNPSFRPDFLKIYPTLVTPGSEIEHLWEEGNYQVYGEETLVDLIAEVKSHLPSYVRLQRIQRDIPAKLIVAGSRHSNFRQLVRERLRKEGKQCRCIRCREAGRCNSNEGPGFQEERYTCCGGEEYFLSAVSGEALIGFARLRTPVRPFRKELDNAALLRELHIYGELVPVGNQPGKATWQHRRFGEELLKIAEEKATVCGYSRIAVMSGVGVRPYYRKYGYLRKGPYMVKQLP